MTVYDRRRCNASPMRALAPRIRTTPRRRLEAVPATPTAAARRALGLDALELEELLTAIGDREDVVGDPFVLARLRRGRRALERELALSLED